MSSRINELKDAIELIRTDLEERELAGDQGANETDDANQSKLVEIK